MDKKRIKEIAVIVAVVLIMIPHPALAASKDERIAIDLTQIAQALISLLALFITSKVIPWLKAKTSVQQQAALMSAARIAVYAAEQVYGSGHGQEKMAYAQKCLMDKGYALDMAAIEATVREMNMDVTDVDA